MPFWGGSRKENDGVPRLYSSGGRTEHSHQCLRDVLVFVLVFFKQYFSIILKNSYIFSVDALLFNFYLHLLREERRAALLHVPQHAVLGRKVEVVAVRALVSPFFIRQVRDPHDVLLLQNFLFLLVRKFGRTIVFRMPDCPIFRRKVGVAVRAAVPAVDVGHDG